jgi:hypothetical protein
MFYSLMGGTSFLIISQQCFLDPTIFSCLFVSLCLLLFHGLLDIGNDQMSGDSRVRYLR